MSKEFTAYGEDKILDLENQGTIDAINNIIEGGGGGAIATYSITGTTINATYNDLAGNLAANIMPLVFGSFTSQEFGTYTGLVVITGAASAGGTNFMALGLGGMWTGNVQPMIFFAESATTPLELQPE